jgi:hypothetical protein
MEELYGELIDCNMLATKDFKSLFFFCVILNELNNREVYRVF